MIKAVNKKLFFRIVSTALSIIMIVLSVFAGNVVYARAEGAGITLKFMKSDLDNVSMRYKVADGGFISVDASTADEGGVVRIGSIADQANVVIEATPTSEYASKFAGINVSEGENKDDPPAFNGNWNSETKQYSFPAQLPGGESARTYTISVMENNNPGGGSGNPGGEPGGNQPNNWEDQFNNYMENGLNFISKWTGTSQGSISYQLTNTLESILNGELNNPTVLKREDVEAITSYLADEEVSQEDKDSLDTSSMFGVYLTSSKYVLITAGEDLGGDHLGFEVYKRNESRGGVFERDDEEINKLEYYDYETGEWKPANGPERQWEEYAKKHPYFNNSDSKWYDVPGLILKIEPIDFSVYALRINFPFDNRKSLGWWNAKYKGEVEAAGDIVSDDNWVENGTFELVSVKSEDGKEVYYSNEKDWHPNKDLDQSLVVQVSKAGYDHSDTEHLRPGYAGAHGKYTAEQMAEAGENASGDCVIPYNSIVTIKAIPDAGYQILSAELNGMALTPDEGTQSMYSFKMTNNLHVSGLFEETKDVISVEGATGVSDAKIAGIDNLVEAGNLALTLKDDKDYDDTKALAVAEGEALASLDVELDQIIAKAGKLTEDEQTKAKEGTLPVTDDKFWKTNFAELDSPVTIDFAVNQISLEGEEQLVLVRDHNGVCEEIEAKFVDKDGKTTVSFESDKFSTYTIIKKSATKADEKPVVDKKTGEGLTPASDNNWYLAKDGEIQSEYSDLYYDEQNGWWLVVDGKVAFDYNGLWGSKQYGWWLVKNGQPAFDYNDLYGDEEYGWWKVNGGAVDFEYTGLYCSETYGWWLIGGGQVAFYYNDLWYDESFGWWKVDNGAVDFGYSGIFGSPMYGWWLIEGGQVAFDYSDLYGDAQFGWWKINGGAVDFNYTGLYGSETYGWWLIGGGQVAFYYNDLWGEETYGWWKVIGGAVDFGFTGEFESSTYGTWNVSNGAVMF